jgi:hypothetical protein
MHFPIRQTRVDTLYFLTQKLFLKTYLKTVSFWIYYESHFKNEPVAKLASEFKMQFKHVIVQNLPTSFYPEESSIPILQMKKWIREELICQGYITCRVSGLVFHVFLYPTSEVASQQVNALMIDYVAS